MLRFLYWAVIKATGEKVNFIDENLFDIGSEVIFKNQTVVIADLAVEDNISCEEIQMSMEDLRYV